MCLQIKSLRALYPTSRGFPPKKENADSQGEEAAEGKKKKRNRENVVDIYRKAWYNVRNNASVCLRTERG